MYSLSQLEKQQVGLRLPKYLVDDIDEFTEEFSLNRTDIITEALKSYIAEQKEMRIYEGIESGFSQLRDIQNGKIDPNTLGTLDEFIDELKNS
jgi:metal-responsive CopG/Arc/MetJ family transcriptional regulator